MGQCSWPTSAPKQLHQKQHQHLTTTRPPAPPLQLANAKRMKAEAEAERQAAELLRRRASAEGGPSSLRQLMGLPDAGAAAAPTRSLPAAATRAMVAHAGGCTSLSMERGGARLGLCLWLCLWLGLLTVAAAQ